MSKRKEYDDDDGRTIADMNVDGMPWYNPKRIAQQKEKSQSMPDLSFREKLALYSGVLKAALVVFLAFAVVFFLFILFLTKVWN